MNMNRKIYTRDARKYRVGPYGVYEEVIDGGSEYRATVFRAESFLRGARTVAAVSRRPSGALNRFGVDELLDIPPEEVPLPERSVHPDDYSPASRKLRAKYNMALGLPIAGTRRLIDASRYADEASRANARIRIEISKIQSALARWEALSGVAR